MRLDRAIIITQSVNLYWHSPNLLYLIPMSLLHTTRRSTPVGKASACFQNIALSHTALSSELFTRWGIVVCSTQFVRCNGRSTLWQDLSSVLSSAKASVSKDWAMPHFSGSRSL
uniref:Uncharacterized protein n=1 Tax=Phlegmariurus squarrosus TaxID=73615 RepID=H9M8A7_PHLSQ|nr:hypothetical protein HusqMp02 [Phlegmariurus squarrosus]AEV55814.1 hypothetical protein HusqMp02 [Phlegmariurus squarrosus]